jgi:hypothetical protein
MRMRMVIKALGVLAASALLAGPATAADGGAAFVFDADSGKGVVAISADSELSFNLFGLKPNTRYRVIVSSRGCSSLKGTIVKRSFRTDSLGVAWDPVDVQSTATPKSARIMRGDRMVACSVDSDPQPDVTKITNASPGLLAVSQNTDQWRISLSIGGLRPQKAYRIVALEGTCSNTAPVLKRGSFRSTVKGAAMVDLKTAPVAGTSIGAVAVARKGGQLIFCEAV